MEWTLDKINQYVTGKIGESLNLDYKALAALQDSKELAKDVSSFANSDGGIIIYGIKEKNQIPTAIDSDATKCPNAETIEQILSSHISPKISNLKIHSLPNPNHHNTLLVIEIPRSDLAPHMAKDNRYYKRYNLKSAPMEHYEIEDIRHRLILPNIEITPRQAEIRQQNNLHVIDFLAVIVNCNNSLVLYYSLQINFPKSWVLDLTPWGFESNTETEINVNGANELYNTWTKNFLPPSSMPLWKNKQFTLGKAVKIEIPPNEFKPIYFIVSCPDASDKIIEYYPLFQQDVLSWNRIESN